MRWAAYYCKHLLQRFFWFISVTYFSGTRVATILISPFAKKECIDNTSFYTHDSLNKYVAHFPSMPYLNNLLFFYTPYFVSYAYSSSFFSPLLFFPTLSLIFFSLLRSYISFSYWPRFISVRFGITPHNKRVENALFFDNSIDWNSTGNCCEEGFRLKSNATCNYEGACPDCCEKITQPYVCIIYGRNLFVFDLVMTIIGSFDFGWCHIICDWRHYFIFCSCSFGDWM